MTKREQKIECMQVLEDGMCYTAQNSNMWQNRLIYVICKALKMLLEESIK